MKVTAFLEYARAELVTLEHAYAPGKTESLHDIDTLVRVIDLVVTAGIERYSVLGENFYDALGSYLTASRHRKAGLRSAVQQLAIQFESFLRTLVGQFVPELDIELKDKSGRSRGRLSNSGYVTDFVRHIFGESVNLWDSPASYWEDRPIDVTCYGICFRHQQRAKHEARDFTLSEIESLARNILGAYLFAVKWLLENSDVRNKITASRDALNEHAILSWPTILQYQLSELRIGPEDTDLRKSLETLQDTVGDLVTRVAEIKARSADPSSEELDDLRSSVEGAAYEHEMLATELNMREFGREQEAERYM